MYPSCIVVLILNLTFDLYTAYLTQSQENCQNQKNKSKQWSLLIVRTYAALLSNK